jgi:predicted dehydrogenase
MKRVLRVLLVGVGNRGRWPLQHCRPERGWEVVGLVDASEEHLRAAREVRQLPPSLCFQDLEKALDATRPEAMIICTPTVTHVPFTRMGIERGVAVLCEKGMAPRWEDAVGLVRFVESQKGTFAVAQNYRYGGLYSLVRHVLAGGGPNGTPHLEEPFLLDYIQHRVRPVPGTLTYPFASIWDMSCHHFDNLFDWLGPVADITAHGYRARWSPYAHESNTSAFLRFASGVCVNYTHTHDASRGSLRIEAHGRNGALVIREGQAEFSARPEKNFDELPARTLPIPPLVSEAEMLADFHTWVTGGSEPGISGRHNLEVMAMCEMTVRSIQEGRTVARDELGKF